MDRGWRHRPRKAPPFKIPVDGSAPVRLVPGTATNPVWSPTDDNLIVYSGPLVAGQVKLLGVTPDGALFRCRMCVPPGGASLPAQWDGICVPAADQSLDFWLLDLATKKTRQITRLSDHG